MKSIDFSHAGGFPLTQDVLDYLQQAYTECLNAFAVMGGNGPVIISGMGTTVSGGTTTIADGWFFYNGELVQFSSGSYTTVPPGDVVLIDIAPYIGNLTYNDGSIFGAILSSAASLSLGPTATTATQFPFSALQPFQLVFGQSGRESAWSSLAVSTTAATGGVTGTVYYKKNFLTNTLQIRAVLNSSNAQNFAASPGAAFSLMGTLPAGYIPNNNANFTAYYLAANLFKDDLGVAWIKQINTVLNTTGQLLINWLKPDISVAGYTLTFNTILPLD